MLKIQHINLNKVQFQHTNTKCFLLVTYSYAKLTQKFGWTHLGHVKCVKYTQYKIFL